MWNIHNNSVILRIPYWLSIAYVNAFYHPNLKWFLKEKLRLRFLKGRGERFREKRKKAVDIIIYPFVSLNCCIWKLSFWCHEFICLESGIGVHHWRCWGASVGTVIHIIPANASGRSMTSDYQPVLWPAQPVSVICDGHSTETGVLASSTPAFSDTVTSLNGIANAS